MSAQDKEVEIIATLKQLVKIPKEVIHVSARMDIQELVLLVLVMKFFIFFSWRKKS